MRVERDGAVAVVTLARPASLNALDADLVDALRAAAAALPEEGARCC